jgi:Na+-driven multidrug efflux pump
MPAPKLDYSAGTVVESATAVMRRWRTAHGAAPCACRRLRVRRERALRVAWTGAAMAGGLTGAIGFLAAAFPVAWLSLFGNDPKMIETGASYLHIVGPFYGFFGGGLAHYFASQGAGRVGWAMMVAVLRVIIAAGGGWLAVRVTGGSTGLFVALAAALLVYGLANVAAVAGGAWFTAPKMKQAPAAQPAR